MFLVDAAIENTEDLKKNLDAYLQKWTLENLGIVLYQVSQ
jgi:transcription termination factor NusB